MNLKYIPHYANYTVCMSSVCPFFSKEKSVLTYDIQVKYLKTEGQEHLIEVHKTNVRMNGEEVHDAFNDILLMTGEALNKVIVRINATGKVLGLTNHNEINKKWIEARKQVETMYQGDLVAAYLDRMQVKLETSETLWKELGNCFFYTIFFNGLYNNYGNTFCIQEQMICRDLLPTEEIDIQAEKKISMNAENNFYLISLQGASQQYKLDQSTKDFFKKQTQVDILTDTCFVGLGGNYTIQSENTSITTITMQAKVIIENIYQKTMQIDVIRQAY